MTNRYRLSGGIGPFFPQRIRPEERKFFRPDIFIPGQDSEVYPQRPHPKDAVKRMQKATMPIIHRSSDFMVLSPLLIVIG
jgi:hypothetical protein